MPVKQRNDQDTMLQGLLQEMSYLVDEQLANAMTAVVNQDKNLAKEVRKNDDEVDALEVKVDAHCEKMLAAKAFTEDELRYLITAIKINTDLERIGDQCKNIAKAAPYFFDWPKVLEATQLEKMAIESRSMLRKAYDAFRMQDTDIAQQVREQDDQVDKYHKTNVKKLIKYGKKKPDSLEAVAHLLTASKALERVSDHAMNIAESVIFMVEANNVRHGGGR